MNNISTKISFREEEGRNIVNVKWLWDLTLIDENLYYHQDSFKNWSLWEIISPEQVFSLLNIISQLFHTNQFIDEKYIYQIWSLREDNLPSDNTLGKTLRSLYLFVAKDLEWKRWFSLFNYDFWWNRALDCDLRHCRVFDAFHDNWGEGQQDD